MKILYIDQTAQMGGGEIALLPWLQEKRRDAHVVLFEDGPFRSILEQNGLPVTILPLGAARGVRRESGFRTILSAVPALFMQIRRLKDVARPFDVLYANSQKAFLLAAFAKAKRQPLVWHLRDMLTADHFSGVLRKVAVLAGNRRADLVIANSQATADAFVAAGGNRRKVRVVHDGVSSEPFDHVDPERARALRDQLVTGPRPLVGVFGRLSPWKGQHVLLEAISTMPEVHAVLVGSALFGEDEYAAKLQARANEADLAGRVHFAGFQSNVSEWMKSVDIVTHTSISPEPFGLVIVEGMLAEKPVIATRAGGAIEIVRDGESGLLVEPGSVEELRGALQRILGDANAADNLARGGRRRAIEAFSIPALVDGISAALQSLGLRHEFAASRRPEDWP